MCITSEKHDERTHRGSRKRYERTHHGSAKTRRMNAPWPQRARRKCAERTQPPQTRAQRKCAERTQMLEPPPARRNATKRSHFSQSARQNSCLASGIGRRKFFAKRSQSPILGDHVTDPGRRQNARTNPPDDRRKYENGPTEPCPIGGLTGSPGVVSIEATLAGMS
jgi:hypothetical protein